MEKLTGLWAAPFTPFTEDGSIHFELIEKMADQLAADHISGAYICGTTGEGISCTVSERIALMEAWKAAAKNRFKLIAHSGALALGDVKVLSEAAQRLEFQGNSVIPTTFFRPGSVKALADYCAAAASFAPELPFYYYHTMNSNVMLSMADFLKCVDGIIPNFAGIKFNCHNLYDYQNCLNYENGKFDIIFGVDEFFAGALSLGAQAFIGSTYNYSAPIYFKIWEAWKTGDQQTVKKLMDKVCKGVDLLVQFGGIPAGKAMMQLKNIDCGPARLPLKQYSLAERTAIAEKASTYLALD